MFAKYLLFLQSHHLWALIILDSTSKEISEYGASIKKSFILCWSGLRLAGAEGFFFDESPNPNIFRKFSKNDVYWTEVTKIY